ncbi:hypothetical protein V2J09_022141 [Rumex salicifolius]
MSRRPRMGSLFWLTTLILPASLEKTSASILESMLWRNRMLQNVSSSPFSASISVLQPPCLVHADPRDPLMYSRSSSSSPCLSNLGGVIIWRISLAWTMGPRSPVSWICLTVCSRAPMASARSSGSNP